MNTDNLVLVYATLTTAGKGPTGLPDGLPADIAAWAVWAADINGHDIRDLHFALLDFDAAATRPPGLVTSNAFVLPRAAA